MVGAVRMRLIAVVSAVIVSITGPVLGNAATTVALELRARAGVAAARLIAVVATVVVIVTAPIDVNTSAIVASELGEEEAGRISTGGRFI